MLPRHWAAELAKNIVSALFSISKKQWMLIPGSSRLEKNIWTLYIREGEPVTPAIMTEID